MKIFYTSGGQFSVIMIKPQNTEDTQELVCYLANKLESYHVELKFIKMNESLGPKVLLIIIENYGKKTIQSYHFGV